MKLKENDMSDVNIFNNTSQIEKLKGKLASE